MKQYRLLSILLLFFTSVLNSDPLLVAVLMVKNEASVMVETLQPLVDGGIKDFLIFDTGSTDGTQAVTKKFFKQYKQVHGYIEEEPFIDFATSRNHALQATRKKFPKAVFMIMLDAEWYMHGVEECIQFCAEHRNDPQETYSIAIEGRGVAFHITKLFRRDSDIFYTGVVHECINKATNVRLPQSVYFEWRPSKQGKEKSEQRWKRDVGLLLKSYQKDPTDARTLFYLGQTYHCINDLDNAFLFYSKRAEIQTGGEEDYATILRLGVIAQEMEAKGQTVSPIADDMLCPASMQYLLKAFSLRPRAEPLVCIANYYLNQKEYALAYLYALRAAQMPYPEQDDMVEKYLYDFTRYDILGKCAWFNGAYEVGLWATEQALKVKPDEEYLQHNVQVYTQDIAAMRK